jgi:hypothetical protein
VVDFSQMSTTEIQGFFKERIGNKICGNFKASQLDKKLSAWQNALKSLYERIENKFSRNIFKTASLISLTLIMNLSGCQSQKQTIKKGKIKVKTPIEKKEHIIRGDVMIEQTEPAK